MGVQVNSATKDGKGIALPLSARQFISFSYGGKNIEDFDLIVSFSSNRLEKEMYANFKDITTTNEIVDGQFFWKSVIQPGKLKFTLATDGMSSENYDNFKSWFAPGETRELILTEFPNRFTMARVATAPKISLLPFEEKKELEKGSKKFEFSTSLYKGEIELEFVMDDPYWYAKNGYYENITEENAKIIYEDKIPTKDIEGDTSTPIFLGDNYYVLGTTINKNKTGVNPSAIGSYIYNCGTAVAKPVISFIIDPLYNAKDHYVNIPKNEEVEPKSPHSYFGIGNIQLDYSTPGIYVSYNNVIDIFNKIDNGDSILEVRRQLRDEIYHYFVRAYAISLVEAIRQASIDGTFSSTDKAKLIKAMKMLFKDKNNESLKLNPLKITFDSKFGTTTIKTNCRGNFPSYENGIFDFSEYSPFEIEEDAGDMVRSEHLKIERSPVPMAGGVINSSNCLLIRYSPVPRDLIIDFKYTYL